MKIFISWSGNLSHQVALILRDWLPNVIQIVDPYVSSEDIDKGARWASDISKELAGASLGIICLTRSNLEAPWILFEAGALSKSVERSRVVPLLIDISPSDIKGPLVQFQASSIAEDDIRKMVNDINTGIGEQSVDPKRIEKAFQKWWPEFDRSLQEAKAQTTESINVTTVRPERELLEETLELAREISKHTAVDFDARMTQELRMRFSRHPHVRMRSENDPRVILDEIQREWSYLQERYEKACKERDESKEFLKLREAEVRRLQMDLNAMHEEKIELYDMIESLKVQLARYEVRDSRREDAETREGA